MLTAIASSERFNAWIVDPHHSMAEGGVRIERMVSAFSRHNYQWPRSTVGSTGVRYAWRGGKNKQPLLQLTPGKVKATVATVHTLL